MMTRRRFLASLAAGAAALTVGSSRAARVLRVRAAPLRLDPPPLPGDAIRRGRVTLYFKAAAGGYLGTGLPAATGEARQRSNDADFLGFPAGSLLLTGICWEPERGGQLEIEYLGYGWNTVWVRRAGHYVDTRFAYGKGLFEAADFSGLLPADGQKKERWNVTCDPGGGRI